MTHYPSLGAALRDALERWAGEVCLIEADRERENARLTYRQFQESALPLARALQDMGFAPGDRAAILMTNQSKWLISAYAVFYCGGVLVPLDYKLTAAEHLQLLAHSRARWLIVEHYLWRAITQAPGFKDFQAEAVLVTEAPAGMDLKGARRWEETKGDGEPAFISRKRADWAAIVYSSGTGGRPKGCVLTHGNYLEQCQALIALFPFWPGVRYLSILPTNHAIDFMVGFIGPFVCGAAVAHLRTLRPEYVRDAFPRYKITYMSLVPMVLKNLERGLRDRFAALPPIRRFLLRGLIALNRLLTRGHPNLKLSRLLLSDIHKAFGGELRALFVGGAFTEPATLQFFYDLGIPAANGYGLTEAGTAVTLNTFDPFRPDTVGKPLPGVEIKIVNPDSDGIGEVAVRSKTVMAQYLDDPALTAETIVDGWLMTGDLGRLDRAGHLQLFGRRKNMIVTEGGKNIYPEDIEAVFEGLPVKEFCVFASHYLWPPSGRDALWDERLIAVLHPDSQPKPGGDIRQELAARNRRLPDFKRLSGYVLWDADFPRTASLKIRRAELAERIRERLNRQTAVVDL
ncbi:MAG: AMP-binding protein [Terriglobia bacterium]